MTKLTPATRRLLLPMIILIIVMMSVLALLAYVWSCREMVRQERQQQEARLKQAQLRLKSSGQEREDITRYLPVYQQLIQQGFIGEERRMAWVDALRDIQQTHQLFDIQYSIGPQASYSPAFIANIAPFHLYRSTMKLEVPLLHEGDLLVLLESLPTAATAPFLLRECTIVRISGGVSDTLAPTANAICEMDWLTLREISAGKTS
ncbi:hypothetical protein SAMN05192560_2192 [Methylobacillus rhizosphaerae]|uniref:Tfp pilus assembly protein PilO n=1 Tax=Methylobacillus rhizosphaerae TaxID=551994 RepID=A0A239AZ79_9PROT|nr:hypothetical protein [Methylobacillus rhizosphaerae]SNS00681.1 hypothetical protein SAMN05192560_2192 [Methylobacillus rhizosphaerae]